MQFNVAQLMKEHTGAVRRFPMNEDISHFSADDMTVEAPLTGEISLLRDTDGILLTGKLHTQVAVPCVRCLEPVSVAVDLELEEQYYPTLEVETGRKLPTPDDADPDTLISSKHILDATELIRQSLVLAVPMHPVHLDGCPPDAILRDADADAARPTDPRWAALKELQNGHHEV